MHTSRRLDRAHQMGCREAGRVCRWQQPYLYHPPHTVVVEMNGVEEVDFLSSDAIRNLSFLHKKHMRRRVIPNGSVVLSFCHPERSEGSVYIYFMLTDSSQSSEWQN